MPAECCFPHSKVEVRHVHSRHLQPEENKTRVPLLALRSNLFRHETVKKRIKLVDVGNILLLINYRLLEGQMELNHLIQIAKSCPMQVGQSTRKGNLKWCPTNKKHICVRNLISPGRLLHKLERAACRQHSASSRAPPAPHRNCALGSGT